jgi:hypothetical protein
MAGELFQEIDDEFQPGAIWELEVTEESKNHFM